MWTVGQFKQELIKDYNHINLRMFNTGVKRQRVDIVGDKVIILAVHKRIPSLKCADEVNRFVTRITDTVLIDIFKDELKKILTEKYKMDVDVILKDYDPVTEYSGTIIILQKDAKTYIEGLS
ncbi:hypothetical protein BSNK01_16200 [Bacillaceae bacterium]